MPADCETEEGAPKNLFQVPGYAIACLFLSFILVTVGYEALVHSLEAWLHKLNRRGLVRVLRRVQAELLGLGLISLLLSAFQDLLIRIRVNGNVIFTATVMYQTHKLLFTVAMVHILVSTLSLLLSLWKMSRWRKWEDEGRQGVLKPIPDRVVKALGTNWLVHSLQMLWMTLYGPILTRKMEPIYLGVRRLFVSRHGGARFPFYSFMLDVAEQELGRVVKFEWLMSAMAALYVGVSSQMAVFSSLLLGGLALAVLMVLAASAKLNSVVTHLAVRVHFQYAQEVLASQVDELERGALPSPSIAKAATPVGAVIPSPTSFSILASFLNSSPRAGPWAGPMASPRANGPDPVPAQVLDPAPGIRPAFPCGSSAGAVPLAHSSSSGDVHSNNFQVEGDSAPSRRRTPWPWAMLAQAWPQVGPGAAPPAAEPGPPDSPRQVRASSASGVFARLSRASLAGAGSRQASAAGLRRLPQIGRSHFSVRHRMNEMDELFWFGRPRLLLWMYQYAYFQASFTLAFELFSLWAKLGYWGQQGGGLQYDSLRLYGMVLLILLLLVYISWQVMPLYALAITAYPGADRFIDNWGVNIARVSHELRRGGYDILDGTDTAPDPFSAPRALGDYPSGEAEEGPRPLALAMAPPLPPLMTLSHGSGIGITTRAGAGSGWGERDGPGPDTRANAGEDDYALSGPPQAVSTGSDNALSSMRTQ